VSQKLIVLVVASALVFGSIAARAAPASEATPVVTQTYVSKNQPPLKPAGAAGIREAQGIADVDVWFISGLIVAAIVAALLLADDDEATNSTN